MFSGQSKRELLKLHTRAWRHIHILAHRKLKEEDHWVPATLGWIVRHWLRKIKITNKTTQKKLQQPNKTLMLANVNMFLESIYKWPGTKEHKNKTQSQYSLRKCTMRGQWDDSVVKNAFSTTLVTWFPSDIKAEGENRLQKIVLWAPCMLCAHSHPHHTHTVINTMIHYFMLTRRAVVLKNWALGMVARHVCNLVTWERRQAERLQEV